MSLFVELLEIVPALELQEEAAIPLRRNELAKYNEALQYAKDKSSFLQA